jgi:hypothetical protein
MSDRVPAPGRPESIRAPDVRSAAACVLAAARWGILALALGVLGCAKPGTVPPSRVPALQAALVAGDLAAADRLIASEASLDAARALDVAIRSGLPAAVRHYLGRAGLEAPLDPDGSTPLIRAVEDAPLAVREEIVTLLLERGASPERADRYGRTARSIAVGAGRTALVARFDAAARGPNAGQAVAPVPPFAAWLGSGATPSTGGVQVQPLRAVGSGPLSPTVLISRSPWQPALGQPNADRIALRFHSDGEADVLRLTPDGRTPELLATGASAWAIEEGRLRLAIVAPAFSTACAGALVDDALLLECTPQRLPRPIDEAHARDLARAALPAPPGPAAVPLEGRAEPTVWPVTLTGVGPLAGCRPRGSDPTPVVPDSQVRGDWYVLDTATLRVSAPLSGAHCLQTQVQALARRQCEASGATGCVDAGGCPSGQVSALATLPGAVGAWVGCGNAPAEARRRALRRCENEVGCDCQLVALSGANRIPVPRTEACEAASR